MRNRMMLAAITSVVMTILFAVHAHALDQAAEDAYSKARMLLNESNVEEARKIFNDLAKDNASDFKVRLGLIDATLEEARLLKAAHNGSWESKVYSAYGELKGIFKSNSTSPDIFVSFAKSYWLNDRFGKAERSLKKAFYYDPEHVGAHVLKGDMFFEKSKEVRIDPFDQGKSNQENYESQRIAKSSYEKVLNESNGDPYTNAMMNYKLGSFYAYHGFKDKARECLGKTIESSPDSYWGGRAKETLSTL